MDREGEESKDFPRRGKKGKTGSIENSMDISSKVSGGDS
jgi:hypothetical protein